METYKDIPGCPNYEVSPSGLVRNKKTNRLLKPSIYHSEDKPYARVKLVNDSGIPKNFSVHRLVAKLYIPNPENKPYTDHINGNSLDNNVTNLRWATAEENAQNCCMNRRNTSGFKGVYFHKVSGKYMAYVRTGGHMVYLGLYETAEDASVVATEARNIAHGDFARHS